MIASENKALAEIKRMLGWLRTDGKTIDSGHVADRIEEVLMSLVNQPTPPPAAAGKEMVVPTNYPWLETAHFLPDSSDTVLLAWVRGDHVTYRTGRYIDGEFIGSNRNSFRTAPNYFREVTGLFMMPDEGDKLRAELTAAGEERDFCLAAIDATEWIRINAMSGEEVKKELLEKGYTDERINAGLDRIRAMFAMQHSASIDRGATGEKAS